MSCRHCQDPNLPSEQCPSIEYSLGQGQHQFHTFQGPTSESYPSNFNSEGWNCSQFSLDQSYQNSQSNWSYTESSTLSWEFDNDHKKLMSTLEESFKSMQQTIVETNQQLFEVCAHMDKILTHLSQHVSSLSPDQVHEFHQLSQIEFNGIQMDKEPTIEEAFANFQANFKPCTL